MISLTGNNNTPNWADCKPKRKENQETWVDRAQLGVVRLKEKIEDLAELRNWSITKVAEGAGISPSTLRGAMDGKTINVVAGLALAKGMDVPPEWLFDDSKGWPELTHRPFWMPPGINPGQEIDARRKLEATLELSAEDVAAAKKRKLPQRGPDTIGSPKATRGSRRKSAS